ncbi:MAG: hypothetical protein K2I10_08980 [Lachnospiraceae bacterium]|nr:hypothetical protein [Lachnospiraceae bacterium]
MVFSGYQYANTPDIELYMKPFIKAFLKKQQKTYVRDLKKVLGELI